MQQRKLIAIKDFNRRLRPGEAFTTNKYYARYLVATRAAKYAEDEQPAPLDPGSPQPSQESSVAQPPASDSQPKPRKRGRRGRYERRDQRAAD